MASVSVYDLDRKSVGTLDLADEVFGQEVNEGLLYDIVKAQLASKRAGDACTKGRSQVQGSTRKLYKQKGTGNARHGSIRAPIFVGGGTQHGPKPRSYAYRPTRKMRAGALKSALSLKLKEERLVVVDGFAFDAPKTKRLASVLETLEVPQSSVIVDVSDNDNLKLSIRNLRSHMFLPPEGVNVYDVLRHDHLVISKEAVKAVEQRLKS